MREIMFRGKKHDGTWAYGSLIHADEYCCILEDEDKVHPMNYPYLDYELGTFDGKATPVDFKTVGQYTGKVDKNGTKIFEGDVVDVSKTDYIWPTRFNRVIVEWDDAYAGFDPFVEYDRNLEMYTYAKSCIVIGNIHDNPELMK